MSLENRILQNIKVNELTNCWNWQKGCDGKGYGTIWVDEKQKSVHRVAYEIFKGEIPDGLCVCHSCDNPRCCNPDHLWLGTQKDNIQDMFSKGRQGDPHVPHPNVKGSKNPNTKLTEEQVIEIRVLLAKGIVPKIIGEQFSVTKYVISDIKLGRSWSHTNER